MTIAKQMDSDLTRRLSNPVTIPNDPNFEKPIESLTREYPNKEFAKIYEL